MTQDAGNDAAALLNGDALADVVQPTTDGASSVLPCDTVRAALLPTDPAVDSPVTRNCSTRSTPEPTPPPPDRGALMPSAARATP